LLLASRFLQMFLPELRAEQQQRFDLLSHRRVLALSFSKLLSGGLETILSGPERVGKLLGLSQRLLATCQIQRLSGMLGNPNGRLDLTFQFLDNRLSSLKFASGTSQQQLSLFLPLLVVSLQLFELKVKAFHRLNSSSRNTEMPRNQEKPPIAASRQPQAVSLLSELDFGKIRSVHQDSASFQRHV
jgi:hypothetical protein